MEKERKFKGEMKEAWEAPDGVKDLPLIMEIRPLFM